MRSTLILLIMFSFSSTAAGCGRHYQMEAPAGFVKYQKRSKFEFITADGVRMKARDAKNYPKADLPFWVDALKRHLAARGYILKDDKCFQTTRGLNGCTEEFVLPLGAEDWTMSVTTFVVGDRVVIVEAAGPYERFAKVSAGVNAALRTFDPGP